MKRSLRTLPSEEPALPTNCGYIGAMNELNTHYRLLLGLDSHWEVQEVDLSLELHFRRTA